MPCAPIGASFTFLALATGSIWGKPMWGTWWVWDARLTSELLLLFLYLTIASGAGLGLLELYSSCRWIYLGKGVMVGLKVALVIAAGIWWEQRVIFLLLVVLVGSIGSHMPARFRYYSFLHGRTIVDPPKVSVGSPVSSWRQ